MKNLLAILFLFLLNTSSFAQTCMVDTLVKELNIDSSKYSIVNCEYLYPDTIAIQIDMDYIKIQYRCGNDILIIKNDTILFCNYNSSLLIYGNIRKAKSTLFDKDWLIITIPHEMGYGMSDFIIINLSSNTFFKFNSLSTNYYLLNDYNNDGIIDFLQVNFQLLTPHKNIAIFYQAIITNYTFKNNSFEKQNITVPKNTMIFVHEKCGCYTKEIE